MIFDNLEYISIKKQLTDFPKHYHETFCISLIHSGVERIDLNEKSIYSGAGSITITNPYEIHSNPLIDPDLDVNFDTIYISKDVMKYALKGENVFFDKRKINDYRANLLFIKLRNAIDLNITKEINRLLIQFASVIKAYSRQRSGDYAELNPAKFAEVSGYIENHITDKFDLEQLSKIAHINRFSFVKNFKTSTGMSPMSYILMKKIFSAKKKITKNSELTHIAYDYNFTDMAHFSRTFKRYIGVSPKEYRNNI